MMNIYQFSLYLGFTGLVSMAVMGVSSAGGHAGTHVGGHGGSHGVGAHGHGATHGATHGGGHSAAHGHSHHSVSSRLSPLMSFLSPRVFFSVALGFGAAGILGRKHIVEPWMLILALVCGLAFELVLFRPTWNLIFRFASAPARTLESAVAEEAIAVTSFDANGNGLVSIDLDGQVRQILAHLSLDARQSSTRVRTGDRLFVEDVDLQKNSCIVSPMDATR
jgi:translation initiation factor IF-1